MKKYFLFGILGLVVLLVIVVSMQPQDYSVERSVQIETSNTAIFKHVIDLRAWSEWSPWIKKDPLMKMEYSDPAAGTGANVTWNSEKEGTGKQTITDSIEGELIKIKLEFYKPFSGQAYAYFKFKKLSDQTTEVFWLMEGQNQGFLKKFAYLAFNIPKMIGKDFEIGLKNLKNISEAGTPSFK